MPIRRIPSGTKPAKAGRPNTINFEQRALDDLLNELDDGPGEAEAAKRRDFVRWPFRQTSIKLRLTQALGMTSEMAVACRNLSCGGASLLHSSYLHPGSKVRIELPQLHGGFIEVDGEICRCKHVRGVIHEIGVKFARKIETKDYLASDEKSNRFSLERVEPERLQGTIVQIDDSPMDRRLIQHYLRGTQIRLRQTEDADEAFRWIQEGCDLAFIDVDLGPNRENGFAIIRRLREVSCSTPLVLLTADFDPALGARPEHRTEASLIKPVTQELVLRAIAEFLLMGAGTGPVYPTLAAGHPNLALIDGFLADLRTSAAALQASVDSGDAGRCRSMCSSIMGTAPAMGFPALGAAAEQAAAILATTNSVRESAAELRAVLAACDRVRPPISHAA